jgi:hypothetical protein
MSLSQIAKKIPILDNSYYVLECTILGLGCTFSLFLYNEMSTSSNMYEGWTLSQTKLS